MIKLPETSELFGTINAITEGKAYSSPENKIEPVKFMVTSSHGFDNREANSMWAATEWLKKHNIHPDNVVWL